MAQTKRKGTHRKGNARGGTSADRHRTQSGIGPVRRCLVTGESLPQAKLIRFVLSPDGQIIPDVDGKLPGRGLWLSAGREVFNTAGLKRAFSKAARQSVEVDDGLVDQVETQLAGRCINLLGLARRAGEAVAGFEKSKAMVMDRQIGVLLAASDGAVDGRKKLQALLPELDEVDVLTSEELGKAMGRDHAVHAVVAAGGLADRIAVQADRLRGLRRE